MPWNKTCVSFIKVLQGPNLSAGNAQAQNPDKNKATLLYTV